MFSVVELVLLQVCAKVLPRSAVSPPCPHVMSVSSNPFVLQVRNYHQVCISFTAKRNAVIDG